MGLFVGMLICLALLGLNAAQQEIQWERDPFGEFAKNCDFPDSKNIRRQNVWVDSCATECSKAEFCTHWTWDNSGNSVGNCWLKHGPASRDDAVVSEGDGRQCGFTSQTTVSFNEERVGEGCDFFNNDLSRRRFRDWDECREFCFSEEDCTHWTFSGADITCYAKSRKGITEEDAWASKDSKRFCGFRPQGRPEPQDFENNLDKNCKDSSGEPMGCTKCEQRQTNHATCGESTVPGGSCPSGHICCSDKTIRPNCPHEEE